MLRKAGHVAIFVAVFVVLAGCGRPRVIPEKEMVSLYVDMFLADQWLRDHPEERKAADSTLFFDPVFRKHGYTFGDYEKSISYYVAHPDVFSDISMRVTDELRRQTALKQGELDREKAKVDYDTVDFISDTLWHSGRMFWPYDSLGLSASSIVPGLPVPVHSELRSTKIND